MLIDEVVLQDIKLSLLKTAQEIGQVGQFFGATRMPVIGDNGDYATWQEVAQGDF